MNDLDPVIEHCSKDQYKTDELPGLLGSIARYIYYSAPYPNEQVAVAGAIAFLAAITGRAFNVSGTGLNVYLALLGSTAIGKEAAQSGTSRVLKAVVGDIANGGVPAALDFIGPSYIASGQALHKRLARPPHTMMAPIGEIGLKLASWGKVNAQPSSALWLAMLLDVFGKSGGNQMLQGAEYSDKANNVPAINSPCLTLLGDSTPETWYAAHKAELISNGLAGRFITLNAGSQQGEHNPSPALEVPADLVDPLRNLCAVCLSPKKPFDVELDVEADDASTELRNAVRSKINSADNEITRHLYGRVHLNVLKLAAIRAVGRAPAGNMPTISKQDMMWASRIVCAGVDLTAHKVANDDIGEVGGNQTKQLEHVERVLTEYTWGKFEDALKYLSVRPDVPEIARQMFDANVVTEAYIQRRLFGVAAFKLDKAGPTFAIKRAIKSLLEADDLRELSKQQTVETFGVGSKSYTVSNPHRFAKALKHLRSV